mgnify:CR=1 FL=1
MYFWRLQESSFAIRGGREMFHLIKYSVIRKVKNFSMLFWPCMFPLILGTLFYFAFGNISESDFETVQAAFVEENPEIQYFRHSWKKSAKKKL